MLAEEDGVTAIEYALVAMLVALAISAGAVLIGVALNGMFGAAGNSLQNATLPNLP